MAEIPAPRDVRTGFHIQYDIGGHVRYVFQSLPGDDRGQCGKFVSLAVRTGFRIAIGRAVDEARSGVLAKITERMSAMQENVA